MWETYFQPTSLDDLLALLTEHAGQARIVAGGTDLMVHWPVRPLEETRDREYLDLSALSELRPIRWTNRPGRTPAPPGSGRQTSASSGRPFTPSASHRRSGS